MKKKSPIIKHAKITLQHEVKHAVHQKQHTSEPNQHWRLRIE